MEKPETTMFEIDPRGKVAGEYYQGTIEGLVSFLEGRDNKKYIKTLYRERPNNATKRLPSHIIEERAYTNPVHYLWEME